MSRGTIACAVVCLASLFTLASRAADKSEIKTLGEEFVFRAVTTKQGPMIEVNVNRVVFLVPYLTVPKNGWPREGELRPVNGNVRWEDGRSTIEAEAITVDPFAIRNRRP
jgi:hypothetical protein